MQAKGIGPHNPFGAFSDTIALSGSAGWRNGACVWSDELGSMEAASLGS